MIDQSSNATGHIETPDGGAMDVYLDGHRMTFRDGSDVGVQLEHTHEDGVTSVFVKGNENLGITNVSAEHWNDPDTAFWEDGEHVEFEHKHTDEEGVLVFEACGPHNYRVEIRSVLPATERSGFFWDNEACPLDFCEGELQQQDRFNVMCLSCERAWGHSKTEEYHYLVGSDGESVTKKERKRPLRIQRGGRDE